MRFYWNKLGPKSNDWNPFKRRGSQRRTWKTPCEGRGWGWSEASTSQGRPRIASQPELDEARKVASQGLRGSRAPRVPRFWTSGPQNGERINSCGFKSPIYRTSLPGNQTAPTRQASASVRFNQTARCLRINYFVC